MLTLNSSLFLRLLANISSSKKLATQNIDQELIENLFTFFSKNKNLI